MDRIHTHSTSLSRTFPPGREGAAMLNGASYPWFCIWIFDYSEFLSAFIIYYFYFCILYMSLFFFFSKE